MHGLVAVPKTVMIDATYLKERHTTSSLGLKRGLMTSAGVFLRISDGGLKGISTIHPNRAFSQKYGWGRKGRDAIFRLVVYAVVFFQFGGCCKQSGFRV
jgi:hypothetical protein